MEDKELRKRKAFYPLIGLNVTSEKLTVDLKDCFELIRRQESARIIALLEGCRDISLTKEELQKVMSSHNGELRTVDIVIDRLIAATQGEAPEKEGEML